MIARVVVENAAYSFDIPFSYQVPQQMQPDIRPGCRVLVPFGKANRAKQGLVLAQRLMGGSKKPKSRSNRCWIPSRCSTANSCGCWSCCTVAPSAPTMRRCGRWCPAA